MKMLKCLLMKFTIAELPLKIAMNKSSGKSPLGLLNMSLDWHEPFWNLLSVFCYSKSKSATSAHEATVEVSAASPASPLATGSPTITVRKLATHLPLAAAHRLLLANRFVLSPLLFVSRFVLPPRRHFDSRLVIILSGLRCANCWTLNARCYLPILSIEHRWSGRFYLFSSGTRSVYAIVITPIIFSQAIKRLRADGQGVNTQHYYQISGTF